MSSTHGSMQLQVLTTATRIKLRELNAHEQRLRAHYDALATDAPDRDKSPRAKRARLEKLYKGTKDLQIVQTHLHPNLDEVGALVQFAASDPWTTRQSIAQREAQLQREIRQRRSLWRHNKLLGALLHESLQEETAETVVTEVVDEDTDRSVAKLTKEETQAQLEGYFFTAAPDVDDDHVYAFLENHVFHRRENYSTEQWTRIHTALTRVRQRLTDFSETFGRNERVKTHEVGQVVAQLLRNSAVFPDEVVVFLTDVQDNTTTQRELAHVLTIELGNLSEFTWPSEGIPVQFQRGMNGRWRCHLQEDAVTLLLFQYVGMKWSQIVRWEFTPLLNALDEPDSRKPSQASVEATRGELRDIFTLAALNQNASPYDGSADQSADLTNASKQDLLRLLCTEARYQRVLRDDETSPDEAAPSITAVTTDLAFFGPSVAHAAVLACLRFFGVNDDVRTIFTRYMQMPLLFPSADAPRIMQRGLSVNRAMTFFLSETLLFVMDFAVRATTGIHLFRRHDDIIFYDTNATNVTMAWETMQTWASVAGLQFNADKSGSTILKWSQTSSSSPPPSLPPSLPAKSIQWGLLELQSDASVRILDDQVDAYANELVDRLATATTVFGWINVYNKYMRFFLRSFGNVSPVFGPDHVRTVTATLQRIHRRVFPLSDGDVTTYLRDRIARDHRDLVSATTDLPAAWTQWPLELGGLGLFNPFLAVWSLEPALREYLSSFHTRFNEPWPREKTDWPWREPFTTAKDKLLTTFQAVEDMVARDGGRLTSLLRQKPAKELFALVVSDTISDACRGFGRVRWNYTDESSNTAAGWRLRTRHEFLQVAQITAQAELQREFRTCLMQVQETTPPASDNTTREAAVTQLQVAGLSGAYWQWLALLMSETLMDEFGTVAFFSRELLPAQLIETIKKTSVAW